MAFSTCLLDALIAAKERNQRNVPSNSSSAFSSSAFTPVYDRCAPLKIRGQGTVSFEVWPIDACTEFSIGLLAGESKEHSNFVKDSSNLELREVGQIIVTERKIKIRYFDYNDVVQHQQNCMQDPKGSTNGSCEAYTNGKLATSKTHQQTDSNVDPKPHRLLAGGVQKRESSYWIWVSIDPFHNLIKVGTGYAMCVNELASLRISVPWIDENDGKPIPHADLSNIKFVRLENENQVQLLSEYKTSPTPVVIDPPPVVVDSNQMTLDMIDNNSAIVSASLPPEAQRLYASVAGSQICVSDEDAQAINYSLDHEGCTLFEKIQSKQNEFGEDNKMVYIRVTLGEVKGSSSGVPFVMEIWPKLCYSPVHNHSDAVAIIKVLYGSINVKYFNPLCTGNNVNHEQSRSWLEKNFDEGAVTYILPDLFQTHRLRNARRDTACITIQCYEYTRDDLTHYEYFDYVTEQKGQDAGLKQQFRPNSDYTYTQLMDLVRREYRQRPQK